MISLTQFRKHCLPLFRLMRDAEMNLEIVYKGKVYTMSIVETDLKPILTRPKLKKVQEVRAIKTSICTNCGAMMFNGICMSRSCAKANPLKDLKN